MQAALSNCQKGNAGQCFIKYSSCGGAYPSTPSTVAASPPAPVASAPPPQEIPTYRKVSSTAERPSSRMHASSGDAFRESTDRRPVPIPLIVHRRGRSQSCSWP